MIEKGPICVIYNPEAGRGRARRTIRALHRDMHGEVHLLATKEPGHAIDLAKRAAEEGFPTIVAAGGDGTVHEVANGILQADRPETIFSVWPIGSANDYAFALGIRKGWQKNVKPMTVKSVDVGRVEGGGKSAYFVNGLGVGFNGAVTLESRRIQSLRGMPLYGLATLKAVWRHFGQPQMRVHFDELVREVPTLAISVNLGSREGNFPVTPAALLDDGWFDAIHAGPLTRWQAMKLLPRMATGSLPSDHAKLWIGRCRGVRVESPVPIRVHLDGEFFCHPEDGVRDLKIDLLPARLRVFAATE